MRTSAGEVSEVVHRQLHTRTPDQLPPRLLTLGNLLPTWTKMPSSIPTPRAFTISLLCLAFFPPSGAQDTSQSLWDVRTSTSNNNNNSSSSRIDNLVASMTPEEKVRQVHHFWTAGTQDFAAYVNGTARLRIPPIQLADGEACVSFFFFSFPFFLRQGKDCGQVIM